jgi:hypothetical protein
MSKILSFNNKLLANPSGLKLLCNYDDLPLLPPRTIRIRMRDGVIPTHNFSATVLSQVSTTPNIWDLSLNASNWRAVCSSINPIEDLLQIIDGNLEGVNGLIWFCQNCTNLTSVRLRNTSGVGNWQEAFNKCSSLTDVVGVDISGASGVVAMFADCTSLTDAPDLDTSNLTSLLSMFRGCSNLVNVPVYDLSSVTSLESIFKDCTSLKTLPAWDTRKVKRMLYMFQGCTSLEEPPNLDTRSLEVASYMFGGCSSLKRVPLYDTSSLTHMSYMFEDCVNVESGALALYQQASSQSTPPTYHTDTFNNCGTNTTTGSAELAQIPTNWK